MQDLTQPDRIDVALRQLIERPPYAAQILAHLVGLLEMHPTEQLTALAREQAIDVAAGEILHELPQVVCAQSLSDVYRALPDTPTEITRGEYALRLRAAARGMG
ncbi:hypothetical protein [Streptomyces sp. NBC_00645]|uniref:hypothetical protein n=1 Tax=Streptomyces sp. NBC_00645 TaxID=2975795 RepID=UPI003253C8E2